MSDIIKDGTGSGKTLKIDSTNRAHVDSVSRSQSEHAAILGQSFNINTGAIALSTDSESAVFYLKYTGNKPLVIKEVLIITGGSTGGSGNMVIKIQKNPATGTIKDNAVAVDTLQNRDFSSSTELDANVYKGVEGDTINGTTFADTTRSSGATVVTFDASTMILRKGNSVGVSFTPATGNTSQSVKVALTAFIETADVEGVV